MKKPSIGILVASAIAVVLIFLSILAWRWSREPSIFDPVAATDARLLGQPTAPGATSVSTLLALAEILQEKHGGYLMNDRMPPGAWLDNMPSWEWGVLLEIRSFTQALRENLSRARAQSPERPELVKADASFSFDHDAWMLPSSENEYQQGMVQLQLYLDLLQSGAGGSATFTVRGDALADWLRRVESRLGALSARLRANAGEDRYDPNILTSTEEIENRPPPTPTPRREVDNVFYEARGSAWALYHLLKAIKIDFQPVLDQQFAMGPLNRALSNLYSSQGPVHSPWIMNGTEFGMVPNHSLTLAAHLAKTQVAVRDLRSILSGDMR